MEGQTSYVMRLAEEHSVSVGVIVGELLAKQHCVQNGVAELIGSTPNRGGNGFTACDYTINGVVLRAEVWVRALECVTGRNGLYQLTMLSYRQLLTHNLFKDQRSWCPLCFEEWRATGQIIYEPLIWGLGEVSVCLQHKAPLESVCPSCGRKLRPLASKAWVGYCSSCDSWLGRRKTDGEEAKCAEVREEELWRTQQCAALLGMAPFGAPEVMRRRFARHVEVYIDQVYGGWPDRFARHLGMNCGVVQSWPSGNVAVHIRTLLRVCETLGVAANSFVSNEEPTTEHLDAAKQSVLSSSASGSLHRPKRRAEAIRIKLQETLEWPVPPSLHDVARELGYTSSARLIAADRELCQKIKERHLKGGQSRWWLKGTSKGKCTPDRIKAALEQALCEIEAVSVKDVATRLGYAKSGGIRTKFPELCSALTARCASLEASRQDEVKEILVAALEDWPPPALFAIARRCGHAGAAPLLHRYPTLCKAVDDRYRAFKDERVATFEQVSAASAEDPPPSWNVVCVRLKTTPETLRRRHPELQEKIVRRHREFVAARAKRRKQIAEEVIPGIVADCVRRGAIPNYEIVAASLPEEASRGFSINRLICASLSARELDNGEQLGDHNRGVVSH